ncbi:MAG: uroporphyrinogen-III C-methyltransferase [Dehalococcoidia bacterium]|nr:uroporphyrinogen-III C-methyltransferase [Dehalococcoidia bacterium]
MSGRVFLVGAGPGDPGLLTVRGLELLKRADVVVYDRLMDTRLLEHARDGAELIDAGKGRGLRVMSQEGINALLVEKGQAGKQVIRLKGGDPFVFGRGGEEAEALAKAGVAFEVVPGVTSAIAAPAYAGIPVTHRGVASSVAFVTGSQDPAKEAVSIDWQRLANAADTLVVLMGLANLDGIMHAIIAAGRKADTPVALVHWGTTSRQQVVTGTLNTIARKADAAKLSAPVLMVVGDVVSLRERLAWFERRPLFGTSVLVTRTRDQASSMSELLAAEGAQPIHLSTIEVVPTSDTKPLDAALAHLGGYQWVVFTSTNSVEIFFKRLAILKKDVRAFGAARVCAIGTATAVALRERGVLADLLPNEFVSEDALQALRGHVSSGDTVLVPRALESRDVLSRGLRAIGVQVDDVAVYETRMPSSARAQANSILKDGIDAATFTSSSTVKNLVRLLDGDVKKLDGVLIASIGPITSATARELGLHVDVEAQEHTVPGLVRAIIEYVGSAPARQ